MTTDFSGLTFDGNHRRASLAKQALTGLRLALLSLVVYLALTGVAIATVVNPGLGAYTDTGLAWVAWVALSLAAFACGAYGTYLIMEALGWAGFISFFIIASFLIPYFRLAALFLVLALGLDLVSKGGYRITLFGPARLRERPADVPG